jgi:uncharacterized protein YxeA
MKKIVKSVIYLIIIGVVFSSCEKQEEITDKEPPFIVITGDNPVWVKKGDIYIDSGAKAYDTDETGDTLNISYKIQTENNINTLIIGLYFVRYNVSDENGNKAEEQIRKIYVNEF